ncbi:MAG: hypothetical protein K1X94_31225 [Sandaracinaceae bacterium]|nr:hypothetical protein [Sandaracinaceae bacterium]
MSEQSSQAGGFSPITLVLLVGVIATFAMLVLRWREPEPTRESAPLVAPIDEELPDAGDSFIPNLPPVPDLARDRAARTASDSVDPATDALAQEMRLVHEARLVMEEDPREALDLLEQHRQRFPEGALTEEREAYAILAMIRTGAPDGEVERRFTDLVADHPGTSFAPAIREAIAARTEERQRP